MPDLAAAAAAALLRGGHRGPRVPDLACAHSSPQTAENFRKGGTRAQSATELRGGWRLDRASDPVPVGGPKA